MNGCHFTSVTTNIITQSCDCFNATNKVKNGELELVTGIAAIHHVSENKPIAPDTANEYTHTELQAAQQPVAPSRWQTLNTSATGMSIRRHPSAEKNIKIGNLLGIKTKDQLDWPLGLVRWASSGNRDRPDIGVQLIVPQAQSA